MYKELELRWHKPQDIEPKEGQKILAWSDTYGIMLGYWLSEENCLCERNEIGGGNWQYAFSYWLSLPEPPEGKMAIDAE